MGTAELTVCGLMVAPVSAMMAVVVVVVVVIVAVLTLTRIIKSVVTGQARVTLEGQARVTLEWRNTPRRKHKPKVAHAYFPLALPPLRYRTTTIYCIITGGLPARFEQPAAAAGTARSALICHRRTGSRQLVYFVMLVWALIQSATSLQHQYR